MGQNSSLSQEHYSFIDSV